MPRPLMRRRIGYRPDISHFRPSQARTGVKEIELTLPELETIRLKDLEKKSQKDCAKEMNVSQSTFSRILENAHEKIASALVEGRAIRIQGGTYDMVQPRGGRYRAGERGGRGRMRGPKAAGPSGNCVCPKCSYKQSHKVGTPCYLEVCPKCKTKMVRE